MKKVFVLFGLLFAICLDVCFIGPSPVRAAQQTNYNAQVTQPRVGHRRRRHRRRRIRRAVVNTSDKVVDKSKTVAGKTKDVGQDVGASVVDKSKTVGRRGRRVGATVGRRGKHVTNKVVDKTKDAVKPK